MTLYVLTTLVLAPLPWIALYRLDRRCAEGVGPSQHDAPGKVSTLNVGLPLSADHRSLVAPDQADSALGQPGGRGSPM